MCLVCLQTHDMPISIVRPSLVGALAGEPYPGFVGNLAGTQAFMMPLARATCVLWHTRLCSPSTDTPLHSHCKPKCMYHSCECKLLCSLLALHAGPSGAALAWFLGFFDPHGTALSPYNHLDCVPGEVASSLIIAAAAANVAGCDATAGRVARAAKLRGLAAVSALAPAGPMASDARSNGGSHAAVGHGVHGGGVCVEGSGEGGAERVLSGGAPSVAVRVFLCLHAQAHINTHSCHMHTHLYVHLRRASTEEDRGIIVASVCVHVRVRVFLCVFLCVCVCVSVSQIYHAATSCVNPISHKEAATLADAFSSCHQTAALKLGR